MKQYEIARARGDKGWELVLITQTETDIKYATWLSVRANEDYVVTQKKVDKIIEHCINELQSEELKKMCARSFPMFASRTYLEWAQIFGSKRLGWQLLALLSAEGMKIPQKTEEALKNLPDAELIPKGVQNGSGKLVKVELGNGKEIEFPEYVWNHATSNENFPKEVEKEIRRRTEEVVHSCAKEEYEAGYPSVRASAERQLRYEWQQEEMEKMKSSGKKLVWISSHANCSKRCEPFQGKLYSLDKTSGEIDGYKYEPIEKATDIYYTTKAGKVWKNGCLSGFNCRHKMIPYKKGNKPEEVPADVVRNQRKIEEQQRAMERAIRKLKLELKFELDKRRREELKEAIARLMEQYEEFCKKHNIPVNIWRTEI